MAWRESDAICTIIILFLYEISKFFNNVMPKNWHKQMIVVISENENLLVFLTRIKILASSFITSEKTGKVSRLKKKNSELN